jgi:cell division protein FtsB
MFMLPSEKKRLYDEIDTLRARVAVLESNVRDLKMKDWANEKLYAKQSTYGFKLDGTPKAKPGRKPSK